MSCLPVQRMGLAGILSYTVRIWEVALGEIRTCTGFVANFAQEVLKGQLPLSRRGLSGQGVELFGCGEALLNSVCKLPFSQHVHKFNTG